MKTAYDAENGGAELSSAGRASSPRLRRGTLLLITALLLGVVAATIGLWCWVVWWGVTKLLGLMF